jgi:superfamily II DNA/RNA helicase
MNFLTVAVYGGTPPKRQEELLAKGPQVVIGTPGRLTELLQSGRLKPSQYSILVLDEADRLLSRQMVKEVMHLASRLPPGHQTMFFSVQMPKDALEHGSRLLKPGYKHVKAGKVATETVSHAYVIADNYARTLARLLLAAPGKSMAFCAKAAEADQLAIDLAAHGVHSIVLHSNLEPKRRSSAMRRFLDGSEPLLVCTDLAARGIHIEAVLRIYSVGLPSSPEFYLHRSGRTGRMGASGECISIITLAEEKPLKNIYASIGVSATKL